MACKVVLQLSNYNLEKNKKEEIPITIGDVQEDQNISVEQLAQMIANMDKESRKDLAARLRAAKVQNITSKTVEKHQLISNISLDDLVVQYPELSKYSIPKDLQHSFTLIKCYRAEFAGTVYKGRMVDSKGNEIFIVNNIYDAEKLFKYLSIKLNLSKFIQGNNIDEKLKEFEEELSVISKRYHKNIQQLIEGFLVDKNAYNTFRQGDKLYSPKRLINKVLSIVTGELYDEGDKSNLQLELEAIKETTSSSNEWKFEKKRLYDVLVTFFEDFGKQYSYSQFKDLDSEALNSLLTSLFANDVKMLKAVVKTSTVGKKVIKEAPQEKKRVNLKVSEIQQIYDDMVKSVLPDLPKSYKDAAKEHGYALMDALKPLEITTVDSQGISRQVHLEMDENRKMTAFYEVEQQPKVIEKSAYVTLDMRNWSTIGEIYNFGYADQPLFSPTEQYKGFYIYEYFKDGATHYAISRSIISPNSYIKTFSDLNYAKQFIDNNEDTLEQCGLWSIKQQTSRPRISEIEMKGVRVGQIISTLDIQLPSYDKRYFSDKVKALLKGSVRNFHETLSFIEDITTLDTPEKAVAFIYLTHKLLKSKQDYFEELANNKEQVQGVIKQINKKPVISYLVEKEETYSNQPTKYYLKLLQNNGTNIDVDGKIGDLTVQDFIDSNLTQAIEYFNKTFGINITALTRSELSEFSKQNGLGVENKLDVVKAFVYNGQIYINTSNANAQDLFHELSHILLGILKAKDIDMYNEVIQEYQKHKSYKYQFNQHRRSYQHYAEQDVIEETVADLIAAEMFKYKQLGTSEFVGEQFVSMFEDILKKSQRFTESMQDNGLGFSKYISELLNENGNTVQRNMRITDAIRQMIRDRKITENCKN